MTDSYSCINILKILPLFQFYRGHSSVSLTTILRCYPSIQLQFPEVLSSFSLINNSLQKLKLPDYISSVIHKHWGQGLFRGKKNSFTATLWKQKPIWTVSVPAKFLSAVTWGWSSCVKPVTPGEWKTFSGPLLTTTHLRGLRLYEECPAGAGYFIPLYHWPAVEIFILFLLFWDNTKHKFKNSIKCSQ